MAGFPSAIAGGNGKLLVTAMQSPNYDPVAGTGWTINKDWSATFYSVSLPGFPGTGTKVTFAATAPASPNVGDVWYDTAAGLLAQQWNGTSWVPYSISAGAIASGDTVNPNPYFAGGDLSHWSLNDGAQLAAVPASGVPFPWAAEITTAPAQDFPFIEGDRFAVTPGAPLQLTAWMNVVNGTGAIGFNWYDSGGGGLGFSETDFSASPGTWQSAVNVAAAPPGAAQAAPYAGISTAATTGSEDVQVTALLVQGQVDGGVITANSITASQIQAGTVVAGIIDGTTISAAVFEGTNWLENSAGQFMYSGTPASGNLLMSIAPAGGSDAHGNSYNAGFWVYISGQAIGLFNVGSSPAVIFAPGASHGTLNPQAFAFLVNGAAASEQQWLVMSSGKESGNNDAAIQLASAAADNSTAAQVIIEFGGATWGTITAGGFLVVDSWHNITLDPGWTSVVTPQYRMLPNGNVQLRGQATHAGFTAATNINNSNPLPASSPFAYRPAATRVYRPPVAGDTAATVAMGTGGVLQARASGFTATQVFLDGEYST